MLGSQVLEVALGLVLMYLLLSLICASIREAIEAGQKARALDLERGIRELFHDPSGIGLTKTLYDHPLVYGLFKGEYTPGGRSLRNLPSYIPSEAFAVALMDIVARGPSTPAASAPGSGAAAPAATRLSVDALRQAVGTVHNAPVQRALLTAIDTAQGDLVRVQAHLEAWFDRSMERVSGWYKRRTQAIIFGVGLALTVAVNADTLTLVESLVQDDALRKAIIAEAGSRAAETGARAADERSRHAALRELGFPVGWARTVPAWSDACDLACVAGAVARRAPSHVPGWLLTAFAISFGAPFWFDVLQRFMVVRSTVKPKPRSPEDAARERATDRPALSASAPPPHAHEWARGNPQEGVI